MKYDHKIISIGINAFKSNDYLRMTLLKSAPFNILEPFCIRMHFYGQMVY